MARTGSTFAGGCLCGALRYVADGEPAVSGHCYCADCRKASGSGFIPFMVFAARAVRFSGAPRSFATQASGGRQALRNSCPTCAALVFGGAIGTDDSHTIYAGSLDDATLFHPSVAIFTRDRPEWAIIPPGIPAYETQPDWAALDDDSGGPS